MGEELAPKLCGMIIDLPFDELFPALNSLDELISKIKMGTTLLVEAGKIQQEQVKFKD